MCKVEYNQDCAKWFVSERYERNDAFGRLLYVGWRQISPYYKTEGWAKHWAARNKRILTEQ